MSGDLNDCGLFHSFPRYSSRSIGQELDAGLYTLKSILSRGLLLCPETILFPFSERVGREKREGSLVHQTRACFTYLRISELKRHSAIFGSYSIEFDVHTLRSIGAIPVVYMPQPVAPDMPGSYDYFANNLVHQLRDAATIIRELDSVVRYFSPEQRLPSVLTVSDTGGALREIDVESVQYLLRFLVGAKGKLEYVHTYIEALANLLYHVDSAREDFYYRGVDLEYYRQMEWRIFSGLMMSSAELDRRLTEVERADLESMNAFFRKKVEDKAGILRPRSHLTRVVSKVGERSFGSLIRRIWVPDARLSEAGHVVQEAKLDVPVVGLPYCEICAIRAGK